MKLEAAVEDFVLAGWKSPEEEDLVVEESKEPAKDSPLLGLE